MKKRTYNAPPAGPSGRWAGSRSRAAVPTSVEGLEALEIQELFTRVNHPLRLDDLLRYLELSRRAKGPLLALLEDLEGQGKVIHLSGGRWAAAGHAPLISGLLSIQRSGVGFVTPDRSEAAPGANRAAPSRDIFIHSQSMGDAWHGDRVEVLSQPSRQIDRAGRAGPGGQGRGNMRGGRPASPEGRIVRVLERRQKELAVHALRAPAVSGRIFCRPADPRFAFLLLVDIAALPKPPHVGELLLVTPGARLEDAARTGEAVWEGKASASLGREDDVKVQERLVKLNHLIPLDFPPNVDAEAASLGMDRDTLPELSPAEAAALPEPPFRTTAQRLDLRAIPFVTIDGEDARDFDDAIHVATLETGWELRVAIADVSWFVRPGSPLDKEAKARGNSCYFPASVEPMLPEALSNGLCSLRPDEDRLVMAARIRFDAQGRQVAAAFSPGLIRSRARLIYEEVQAAFDLEAKTTRELSDPKADLLKRLPDLLAARDLALALNKRRAAGGSLDFEIPEARFIVDRDTGRVTGIQRSERLFAHRLIEECMLAANEAVARFLSDQGAPFPYRVHPAPDRERLERLFRTLASTGLAPELTEAVSLLSSAQRNAPRVNRAQDQNQRTDRSGKEHHRPSDKRPVQPGDKESGLPGETDAALSKRLRLVLAAGGESPQAFLINRLVLRTMMQARYAPENDRHFGLASLCYCHFTSPIRRYADLLVHRALRFTLEQGKGGQAILAGQKLLAACEQCNTRERVAVEAEREIQRRLACLVLQEHVGESFKGVVSGVTDFGFFVEFNAMPAEGMVRLESLDDHFVYDADRQEVLGLASGQRFRLGDSVEVRLTDVHIGRLEINLELLAQEARPQRRAERGGARRSGLNRPGEGSAERSGERSGTREANPEGARRQQKGPRKSAATAHAPGRKARRR